MKPDNKDQIVNETVDFVKKIIEEDFEEKEKLLNSKKEDLIILKNDICLRTETMNNTIKDFELIKIDLYEKVNSTLSIQEKELRDKHKKAENVLKMSDTTIRLEDKLIETNNKLDYVIESNELIKKRLDRVEDIYELLDFQNKKQDKLLEEQEIVRNENKKILENQKEILKFLEEQNKKKSFFHRLFS